VDAEPDERLMRVIKRDIIERGRSVNQVLNRYEKTVKPMHVEFIEPTKQFADVIVPQGGNNHKAIDLLVRFIKQKLEEQV
jgi:uridine kinase